MALYGHLEWHCLSRIRRCGLVGRSMSFGVGFEVSEAQARNSSFFLLPAYLETVLSDTLQAHVCLC